MKDNEVFMQNAEQDTTTILNLPLFSLNQISFFLNSREKKALLLETCKSLRCSVIKEMTENAKILIKYLGKPKEKIELNDILEKLVFISCYPNLANTVIEIIDKLLDICKEDENNIKAIADVLIKENLTTYFCANTKHKQFDIQKYLYEFIRTNTTLRRIDFRGLELSGINLTSTELIDCDLSNCNLKGAWFSSARLTRCKLPSNLERINLSNCILTECNLIGCDLSNCKVIYSRFNYINLTNCKLPQNLIGVGFYFCNLSGHDLRNCNLTDAELKSTNLIECKLPWDLNHIYLSDCDLSEHNFNNCNFKGASLRFAKLTRCKLPSDLKEIDFSYGNLSGNDLSNCNLKGAILDRANLSRCKLPSDLEEIDFSYGNLSGNDLSNCNLKGAILDYANLIECKLPLNLEEVSLFHCDLNGRNLSNCNLKGANLSWANLTECKLPRELEGINLSFCDLSLFDLSEYKLNGCNLNTCKLNGYGRNFRLIQDYAAKLNPEISKYLILNQWDRLDLMAALTKYLKTKCSFIPFIAVFFPFIFRKYIYPINILDIILILENEKYNYTYTEDVMNSILNSLRCKAENHNIQLPRDKKLFEALMFVCDMMGQQGKNLREELSSILSTLQKSEPMIPQTNELVMPTGVPVLKEMPVPTKAAPMPVAQKEKPYG
jgi:uncharacterized protein YjbI with pentapeptide repeats